MKIQRPRSKAVLWIAILASCFCTLFGQVAGLNWWVADLCSHWLVQYTLVTVVITLFAIILIRDLRLVAVGLGLIFFQLSLLVSAGHDAPRVRVASSSDSIRVYVANIQMTQSQPQAVLDSINEADPDVIVLVEVFHSTFTELDFTLSDRYTLAQHAAGPGAFGVALWCKTTVCQPDTNPHITVHHFAGSILPALELSLTQHGKRLHMIGMHPFPPINHMYWISRNEQLQDMAETVRRRHEPTVIVGDLNNTPWSPTFQEVLRRGQLYDGRRGFGLQASWPQWLPSFLRLTIDQTIVTDPAMVQWRGLGKATGSDHRPVVIDITPAL